MIKDQYKKADLQRLSLISLFNDLWGVGMKILVLGGTRFFGIPMVKKLVECHEVTIATRGRTADSFGSSVSRIILDRSDESSIRQALKGFKYDVIIDKTAYSSNDVRRTLDNISCGKYILMSSSAVYANIRKNTPETDFDAALHSLKWCERADFSYDEVKRQAEACIAQHYSGQNYIAVRYPVVIGEHDYTKRLEFYVEHIMHGKPMNVNNMNSRISFIHETEAGEFLADLVGSDITGAVNGCCCGDISQAEIIAYIEHKTGKNAIIERSGDDAPYNGYPEFSTLNTAKAAYPFTEVHERFSETIDHILNR